MYLLLEKNEHLRGFSKDELLSLDYRFWRGIKASKKYYDYTTGRKTHQDYYYEDLQGNLHLQIRQSYIDIVEDGVIVDIKAVTKIYSTIKTQHAIKEEKFKLSETKIFKQLKFRRERIEEYLILEAEKSQNPLIPQIYSLLFNYLQKGVNTWIKTGKATVFNSLIKTAPTTDDSEILQIFGGVEGYPKSINDLLNLFSEKEHDTEERNMYVHEYLKSFIK